MQLVTAFVTFLADVCAKWNAVVNCLRRRTYKDSSSFKSSFDHGIFITSLWIHLLRKTRKLVSLNSLDGLLTKILSNMSQTHNLITLPCFWNFKHAVKSHTNIILKIYVLINLEIELPINHVISIRNVLYNRFLP